MREYTKQQGKSGDQQQDLFRLQLNYETALNGSTPQYNGNISSMQWDTYLNGVCGQRQLYMFSYDAANRLTAAAHRNWNGASWTDPLRYSESGITYDLNGNIKTYNRKGLISTGVYGDIDLLAYTYGDTQRPDRLTKVVDTGNATKGFKYNPPATGNHYAYDGNGNMTTDNHKKTTITYNYLNLPTVITFTDGTNRKIEWVYDADGTKISKTTSTGVAVNGTKDYVGGIEYNGTNLEAIYFAEGRITPNGAAFFYEYTIKDHLGNTRITFRANGASLTTLQENHYYPFGLEMEGAWQAQVGTENAYQYNGKELNEDFGLNWYDYGARWYDAAVGRWWSVDPLGEQSADFTTYAYVSNNPMVFIDPTGMESEAYKTKRSETESDKGQSIENQRAEMRSMVDKSLHGGKTTPTATTKMGVSITEESTNTELANTSATATLEWDDKKQAYTNPSTLKNGTNAGPFAKFSILDYTVKERDGMIIFSFSYQLDAQRIKWGNIGLNIVLIDKKLNLTANKDIETGGGSVCFNATFQFNAKSMELISQSSTKSPGVNADFGGATNPYVPFSTFSEKNLRITAFTYINWTNKNCGTNFCETGKILEDK